MNILIILLSSLFSLTIITLYNIENQNKQIIIFLLSLIIFIGFNIVFSKMIQKNKLNRYATSSVVNDTKSTIFNTTIVNNQNNENKLKNYNEILDRDMNHHIERRLYYKNSNNNLNNNNLNNNNLNNKIKNSNNKYYIEHEDCIQNNSCSL